MHRRFPVTRRSNNCFRGMGARAFGPPLLENSGGPRVRGDGGRSRAAAEFGCVLVCSKRVPTADPVSRAERGGCSSTPTRWSQPLLSRDSLITFHGLTAQ